MTSLLPPPPPDDDESYWTGDHFEAPTSPAIDWLNRNGPMIFTVTLFGSISLMLVACGIMILGAAIKVVFS